MRRIVIEIKKHSKVSLTPVEGERLDYAIKRYASHLRGLEPKQVLLQDYDPRISSKYRYTPSPALLKVLKKALEAEGLAQAKLEKLISSPTALVATTAKPKEAISQNGKVREPSSNRAKQVEVVPSTGSKRKAKGWRQATSLVTQPDHGATNTKIKDQPGVKQKTSNPTAQAKKQKLERVGKTKPKRPKPKLALTQPEALTKKSGGKTLLHDQGEAQSERRKAKEKARAAEPALTPSVHKKSQAAKPASSRAEKLPNALKAQTKPQKAVGRKKTKNRQNAPVKSANRNIDRKANSSKPASSVPAKPELAAKPSRSRRVAGKPAAPAEVQKLRVRVKPRPSRGKQTAGAGAAKHPAQPIPLRVTPSSSKKSKHLLAPGKATKPGQPEVKATPRSKAAPKSQPTPVAPALVQGKQTSKKPATKKARTKRAVAREQK